LYKNAPTPRLVQAWCSGESYLTKSSGRGFEVASPHILWGKACLGFSLPQTPLMWEPLTLSLPFIKYVSVVHLFRIVDFSIFFYKLGQEVWLGTKLKHHTVLELKVNP